MRGEPHRDLLPQFCGKGDGGGTAFSWKVSDRAVRGFWHSDDFLLRGSCTILYLDFYTPTEPADDACDQSSAMLSAAMQGLSSDP